MVTAYTYLIHTRRIQTESTPPLRSPAPYRDLRQPMVSFDDQEVGEHAEDDRAEISSEHRQR